MENPLFFSNTNYNLFGVLHEPEHHKLNMQKTGAVFCHPFAEEKLIAHRVLVNLARRLTQEGFYCLRFDEMGHGDSEGSFEQSTVETRLSDIAGAIDYLRSQHKINQVGCIGVRFGATLAVLTASKIKKVDFLVMIAPVIDGRAYIEQCLRSNLTTQMAIYGKVTKDRKQLVEDLMAGEFVNIDGYLISHNLYQQMAEIHLLNSVLPNAQHILLVQISPKENIPFEKGIQDLYSQYSIKNIDVELKCVQEDYFWKDAKVYTSQKIDLQNTIANWLKSKYG
jgi:uncharacterized protein